MPAKKSASSTSNAKKTANAKKTTRAKASTSKDATDEAPQSGAQQSESGAPWWHAQFDDAGANPGDVGNAAQEAVRLAAAVASWANETGLSATLQGVMEQTSGGLKSAMRAATGEAEDNSGDDPNADSPSDVVFTCESCPVCQGMEILQSVAPEAAGGLATALDAVTVAVRDTVEMLAAKENETGAHVEHIDID